MSPESHLCEPRAGELVLDLAAQTRDSIPNLKMLLVGEGPHDRVLARPELADSPYTYVVLIRARIEGRNFLARDQRIQGLRDISYSDAKVRSSCPIDNNSQLRFARNQS